MLLEKFAEELDAMSHVDAWLIKSLTHPAAWASKEAELSHIESVRRFHNVAIGMRFTSGGVEAEALTGALSTEMRRLAAAPALLAHALAHASWSDEAQKEGEALLARCQNLGA